MISLDQVTIVIPARNEAASLTTLLPLLNRTCPNAEIVVVDDGSTDGTARLCEQNGVKRIHHPYAIGNGAAIKSGARAATRNWLLFMDGDGQHSPDDIPRLIEQAANGYDMVVGSRQSGSQASLARGVANWLYNWIATRMVGQRIEDLTSGMRLVRADLFRQFIYLLPNGFSYPTTITMAFFRAGYRVGYLPIITARRTGKSHIRLLRDGARFLLIIFKVGTLYSPLKVFFPTSIFFFSMGLSHYIYTFLSHGRFTNMSALLLITAVLVFLLGLVSEQITALMYQRRE